MLFPEHVFGPFFFAERSVTGQEYLKMLQNWLLPQLAEEFISQPESECPTTLAYGCLEVPQWKPTKAMDWSYISCR
jgi:hypothetical protein